MSSNKLAFIDISHSTTSMFNNPVKEECTRSTVKRGKGGKRYERGMARAKGYEATSKKSYLTEADANRLSPNKTTAKASISKAIIGQCGVEHKSLFNDKENGFSIFQKYSHMEQPMKEPNAAKSLPDLHSTNKKHVCDETTGQTRIGSPQITDLGGSDSGSDYGSEPSAGYEDYLNDLEGQMQQWATSRSEPELCDEQLELTELILSGHNVFYSGSASCGKSTMLKYFVEQLKAREQHVRIIAPTGIAALEVGGVTLYNYAGWTPDSFKQSLKELKRGADRKKPWKRMITTHVLIIDEISMVENHVFERLNHLMKEARSDCRPFGGVQVIVTGDFCQLSPVKPFKFCMECGHPTRVVSEGKWYECEQHGQFADRDKWAFRSSAWAECDFAYFKLRKVHRQKDLAFRLILEKCRLGWPFNEVEKDLLLNHKSEITGAIRLFPTREEVGRINDAEMAKLAGRTLEYKCLDDFFWNPTHVELSEDRSAIGLYSHSARPRRTSL